MYGDAKCGAIIPYITARLLATAIDALVIDPRHIHQVI
jgi:hypothetical protein